jgi:hypothetical protein
MCATNKNQHLETCENKLISITPKRLGLIVWLLENIDKEVSVLQASKDAHVLDYHSTHNAFKDLTAAGYLRITDSARHQVTNASALIHHIALAQPFRQKAVVSLFLGGSMVEKMHKINSIEPDTIFTLFAAAELLSPYVRTNSVHAYVPQAAIDSLKTKLIELGARRADGSEADTFLLPTSDEYIFRLSRKKNEFRIAPMGILIADLESYGSLGQEQAARIMNQWLSGPNP